MAPTPAEQLITDLQEEYETDRPQREAQAKAFFSQGKEHR